MKTNLPVTNNEIPFPDGAVLVSKTDMKGMITYANADFVKISGYTREELVGSNHNMVRHPDMPPVAFEDLWDTVKTGKPWSGIVKNRAKNGDYYWVNAVVSPLTSGGNVTGFVSVRNRPTREEIAAASDLYQRINEGKAKLRETTMWGKLNVFKIFANAKVSTKIIILAGLMFSMSVVSAWLAYSTSSSLGQGIESMYTKGSVGTQQLSEVQNAMWQLRYGIAQYLAVPEREARAKIVADSPKWFGIIDERTRSYAALDLTEEQRQALQEFTAIFEQYKDARPKWMALMEAGKKEEAAAFRAQTILKSGAGSVKALGQLIELQTKTVADVKSVSDGTVRASQTLIIILTVGSLVVMAIMAFFIIRAITGPLSAIIGYFGRIAEGNYENKIDISHNDELGKVMQALQTMQTTLSFDMNESRHMANESLRIKIGLDSATTNVMIADTNGVIIYANRAVIDMFKQGLADIREVLPHFDPDKFIGQNIDIFHKNPTHQQQMLKSLNTTHKATIKVGSRSFNLAANPVISSAGERLGTCVEWFDCTAELAVQEEINTLVNAAASGDLTKRVSLEDKQGFMKKLGAGMNELLEVLAAAMDDVAVSLDAMAKGDLTVTITKDYQGTFGKLKEDINATVGKLTEVVTNIKESADMIKTASSEISMGNTNLSQRTQEQASALEETASSMEEMTSTVKQNADNARHANQLVTGTRDQAQSSGEIVTNAVGAMDAITTSSKKIADIISVIDEIAFQTNLLALNAAVEAARAGEQGRGFAVVATEVRNLAQRSATAAKEIKGLINESVENVENGTKHVDASGEVLAEIGGSVKKISDIVAEIAAASQEQATGIEQVNKAVMQMDEMTQQNAALVEEAAAASKSMEEQAVQLAEQVTFFKLKESEKVAQNQPQKTAKVSVVPSPAKSAAQPPKKTAPVLKTVASRSSVAKVKGGTNDVEWDEF